MQKTAPTLTIEAKNVTSARYLTVYYSLDGGSWIEWDNITQNGITRLDLPGGNRAVEFYYITIKIRFTTDTAAQSPILEGATLRFLMRPVTVQGWSFNIPLASGMATNTAIESRSSRQLVQDLKDARDNTGAIEFTDIDGQEYYVHLTSVTRRAIEKDLFEGGDSPNIEYVVAVNIVEAT